jgi:hypothetical protein
MRKAALPMAESTVTVPSRYQVQFPTSWSSLDLHPATRDASIRQQILAGLSERDRTEQADAVRALVRSARDAARDAHARGALQLSGLFDIFEGAPLIAATAVVRVAVPPDERADLPDLMVAYGVRNARLPTNKGDTAARTELVDLPMAGIAGRTVTFEDVDFEGRGWVRMAIMQTIVPIPGSSDLLTLLSSTPNLPYAPSFFRVFEAIAETLQFLGER